jgi:hypothetical protein
MIGIRVGVSVGIRVGVAVGVDANELQSGSGAATQIFQMGDSNGVGETVIPDEYDETFDPSTEITTMPWRFRFSQSTGPGGVNPPYETDITTGGVRPYNPPGMAGGGWRTFFAQEAARAGVSWKLAELAVSGIKALQFTPTSTFPTAGSNLWTQAMAWHDAAEAAFPAETRGAITFLGGNDGFNSGEAAGCAAKLTEIVNAWIAKKGSGIKIAIVRNPDFQSIASTVPFLSTIQTAQDNVAAAFSGNVVLVPTADTKGHSDHLHYDGDSSVIVGSRLFWALFDALGGIRPRPSPAPQIVGWGPQYMSTGAYSPIPSSCGIIGDLEILFAITQSAGGSSTQITAPTVAGGGTAWTAVNDPSLSSPQNQIQSSQTTTSRLGIWARAVTANRATISTPLTTVPSNGLVINGGRIITVRGPNALAVANIDLVKLSVNNAFQTGLTLTGGTTGFSNEGIVAFAGGYRTNVNSNPVTMSGGNVAGLARAFGGNRGVVVDFVTNAAWNASLAEGGPTGDITVAFALTTLGVGAIIGIEP